MVYDGQKLSRERAEQGGVGRGIQRERTLTARRPRGVRLRRKWGDTAWRVERPQEAGEAGSPAQKPLHKLVLNSC